MQPLNCIQLIIVDFFIAGVLTPSIFSIIKVSSLQLLVALKNIMLELVQYGGGADEPACR
jgi:hypothetical protein